MCGFVSFIGNNARNKNLRKIFISLSKINKHRGPDKIKTLNELNYSIIFRRLSIIDLTSNADQPFLSEDNKIKVIFNGEIYNYLELKKELIKKGCKFKTNSDTEVILRSYELYGKNFVKKLRGMFSIVIFDDHTKEIILLRDHFGQKPLYYSRIKSNFIISSEIKDIIYVYKRLGIKLSENKNTVFKYLLRGWCDDTNETFYKNIFSFPASSIGIIKKQNLKIKKYWKLSYNRNNSYNKKEFQKNFLSNLKIHLRSDVPIAFTLSGGLDCSSILKMSLNLNYKNYKAFSLKLNNPNDESNYIKDFIRKNNLNHEFCNVEKMYNSNTIEKIIEFQDEPISSMSFVNQYLLRKKIKEKGFKVIMVGEGGDEVLGGYKRMYIPYIYQYLNNKKKKLNKSFIKNIEFCTGQKLNFFEKEIKNYKKRYKIGNDIESFEPFNFLKRKVKLKENLKYYNPTKINSNKFFKKFMINHLLVRDLPHILRQEDRVSMSCSIENRSPFVDYKFVEYVYSHDFQYFMKNGYSKYMLRNFISMHLPKSYLTKKKIARPGNPENIIKKYYIKSFNDLLKAYKLKDFDNNKILKNFNSDINQLNNLNFSFYFRILNYLIWKKTKLN